MSNGWGEGWRVGRSMSGPALPLSSPPIASARYIYRIIPTPPNQLFFLAKVAPLSCLSLPISVGVCICVRVQPMRMYPLRICYCAACPCPGRNCDCLSSLQLFPLPPSCFVFSDGFCDMRTFCTRVFREAVPEEKNLVGKPSSLE